MAKSVDLDQTAPIGAVCSRSTLFAFILNSSVMLCNFLQQATSADDNFLGALRVNKIGESCTTCRYMYRFAENKIKQ